MAKILNLTQHETTKEQIEAGVIEPASKGYVKQLLTFEKLPDKQEMEKRAKELAWLAEAYKSEGCTKVMIGGAPYFMSTLERILKEHGFIPVYAFSKRECIEEKMPDGSVKKTQVFRHIGFVEA